MCRSASGKAESALTDFPPTLPCPVPSHPCSPGLQLGDREAVWVGELFRAAQLVVTEQASAAVATFCDTCFLHHRLPTL